MMDKTGWIQTSTGAQREEVAEPAEHRDFKNDATTIWVKTIEEIGLLVKTDEKLLDGSDTPIGLDYIQFISILIKAVQELSAKIDVLEAK